MRNAKISFIVAFLTNFICFSQVYQRTSKGIGLQLTGSPIAIVKDNRGNTSFSNYELGASFLRMYRPGLYYKVGYSRLFSSNELMASFGGHFIHLGAGFDKFLLDLKPQRNRKLCIYRKLGLIGELAYSRLFLDDFRNEALGEFNMKIGFSIHTHYQNMSKRAKGRSFHWEIYYFNGLTSFIELDGNKFKRHGAGISLRMMRHQTYNFLK